MAVTAVSPVIQAVLAMAPAGPTTVATLLADVKAGNLLVVMTGHGGGYECASSAWSDTRGLVYNLAVGVENVSGAQTNGCIYTAQITSSGPLTLTRTIASSNYPCYLFVAEVAGSAFVVGATNAATADGGTTVTSGTATSAAPNVLILGVGCDSLSSLFDSYTPVGGTVDITNAAAAFLIKAAPAGTYAATFNKSTGGNRYSAAIALVSFTPAPPPPVVAGLRPYQSLTLASGVPVQLTVAGTYYVSILNAGPGNIYVSTTSTPGANPNSMMIPPLKMVPLTTTGGPIWMTSDQDGTIASVAISPR